MDAIDGQLSPREQALLRKRHALHRKYEKAVGLYADTGMPPLLARTGVAPPSDRGERGESEGFQDSGARETERQRARQV